MISRHAIRATVAVAVLLSLRAVSAQQAAAIPVPGGIAAIVHEEVITWGELNRRVNDYLRSQPEPINPAIADIVRDRLRRQFLDYLIRQSLLLQEARRLGITAEEPEIAARINEDIKSLRKQGHDIRDEDEFYTLLMQSRGTTREEHREQTRKSVLIEKLLWTRVFPPRELVSPGERREYYRTHKSEFQSPSELTFRQIFLRRGEDSLEIISVIDRALDRGVPFAELAEKFSESPVPGGLWIKKVDEIEKWPAPLPEKLKSMKPGEVARAIDTSRGIHYVKMEEIAMGETRPFEDEEVQELIENRIRYARHRERERRFIDGLREVFHVEVLLPDPAPIAAAPSAPVSPDATSDPNPTPADDAGAEGGVIQDVSPDTTRPKKKDR